MDYFLFNFSGVQFHYTMSHIIIDAWCAGLRQEHVYKRAGTEALYIERGCAASVICFADAG